MAIINIEIDKAYLRNDIAVESAICAFRFETGLDDIYVNNGLITESDVNDYIVSPKKKNIFVRAVEKICTAIRRLVTDILDLFNNAIRKNLSDNELENSSVGPRQASQAEIDKIEQTIDDEYRKSNKLIQMISSKTGISDDLVESITNDGINRINKYLEKPETKKAIASGMISGSSSFMKFFKKVKTDSEGNETKAKRISNPKQQRQAIKVLQYQNKLSQTAGRITYSLFSNSKKNNKGDHNEV